ncbi:MAG: NOB1 family endonuclease [Methanospirillum sp.]|uniref:NOB1 family endonuclease n=1 Tax=Methanospirillum sp. TaxID=45200 RepID=UPI00237153B5|nr:NOB1 family endonuclease [Methanospirillum sp.]MDD1729915.1 NOB1 family endonuclease [Methanospirillum sp.]
MQSTDNQEDHGSGSDGAVTPDEVKKILILDTSAFFLSIPLDGILFTVPRVEKELKDLRGKARFAVLLDGGMEIRPPLQRSLKTAQGAADKIGDLRVLSETDTDLIALALELGGTLVTDDFAVQNTALALNIPVQSIIQREASPRIWQLRCTGCGKYYDQIPTKAGDCPICGSALKRKNK